MLPEGSGELWKESAVMLWKLLEGVGSACSRSGWKLPVRAARSLSVRRSAHARNVGLLCWQSLAC